MLYYSQSVKLFDNMVGLLRDNYVVGLNYLPISQSIINKVLGG